MASNHPIHQGYCLVHDQKFTAGGRCPTCAADVAEKAGALGQDLPNYGDLSAQEEICLGAGGTVAGMAAEDFHDGVGKRGARIPTDKLPDLIVTKGGVPFEDQAEGLRQFKAVALSANDRQVGGEHYKSEGLQHWDLVHVFGLDYYLGNATKYLSRAHKKNGRQDYEKAGHYQDKRAELKLLAYTLPNFVKVDGAQRDSHKILWDFCQEQNMPLMAVRAFFALMQGRVDDARTATAWLAENYSAE